MVDSPGSGERYVFTVGHSNHGPERFLRLLTEHGIELLIDVRSRPYSRFCPHFNIKRLRRSVEEIGLTYVYLGGNVGGKPDEHEFYDDEGYVLYYLLARCERFQEGIAEIERYCVEKRTAIMCAEEDPLRCHRRFLIGKVLVERGVTLKHIRGNGRLQTDEELTGSQVDNRRKDRQMDLFDDGQTHLWKSPRPVRKR